MFSIDVFEGEMNGLILCETEAEGLEELMSITFPEYATAEVTEDHFFIGGSLCRAGSTDLKEKLSSFLSKRSKR
ncbi:MAG: hypothetical protein DMF61_17185 [Blastocatellia bacterium AA13]|nr:MAG: hypothetical protein DMF61_17185 [Blastocatellia bacterium AA13]